MAAPRKTPLHALAGLYGIETSYTDMKGRLVIAPENSILAILRAMGAPVRDGSDVPKALRSRREESAGSIEPVRVAWNGRVDLRRFRNADRGTLVLEDGGTAPWPASTLPSGYHRLIVERSGAVDECLIVSAPIKANFPYTGKSWGTFAPAYSLHSKRSFGAGDLTDLEALLSWTIESGGQVVATLPLLAAFLDTPFESSPYSPASRLFWNEFFADLENSPEFGASEEARRLFAEKPRSAGLVDYRKLMPVRRRVLEAMSRTFFAQASARSPEFQTFAGVGSEVRRYAEFRAAGENQGRGWSTWPERMRAGVLQEGDWDEAGLRYHLYAQWLMHQQLRTLEERTRQTGSMLYLDLPLGIHSQGYDTWRYRHLFLEGISGGAPPDPVFTTGQNWSFPPLNPHAMRRDHYRYVIAAIRNHLSYAHLLRIDHVMGLHHLFCIPDGMEGRDGIYLQYPAEELYAILSLESHRHNAGIVGEDLGLVPSVVRRSMKRHNIRGLYILQVEPHIRPGEPVLRPPPDGSIASLNTHDMFPFRAFLDGIDIADRLKLGFLTRREAALERKARREIRRALIEFLGCGPAPEDIFEGCMDFLVRSDAGIVLVNLEDLWMETRPQNIPATTKERPNWRRRMRYSMEQLRSSKQLKRILEMMRRRV